MIKNAIKTILLIIGSILLILIVFILVLKYNISWKITTVGEEQSPDGKHSALFQAVGEADFPFGASHAKVTVKEGDRIIESFREDIYDDGGQFRPDNYSVEWMKYGVVITFMGSEQPDREHEVFFDGRDSFEGYSDEEIADILEDRYSLNKIEKITKDKNGFKIRGDGIDFRADKSMALHDNYLQEVFKATTDEFFPEQIMRSVEWDVREGEFLSDLVYTPIISMNGPGKQDMDSFCYDICEWVGHCLDRLPYTKAKKMYDSTGFMVQAPGYEKMSFGFKSMLRLDRFSEDKVGFYNDLYTDMDSYLNHEYDVFLGGAPSENDLPEEDADSTEYPDEITDDVISRWASYDFDVVYDSPDGREYALVPIDRALGSSFYVLLVFNEKGNPDSAELVNADPFNQTGGEARFITFLNDGKIGFAALSYSGGSQGILYETLDGGKSYKEIVLPSPGIKLPTGELYNPFVMPEEAWEESDTIYLKISQGPDGDHHSAELGGARTVGIYASTDNGKTFEFVREEAEKVIRDGSK